MAGLRAASGRRPLALPFPPKGLAASGVCRSHEISGPTSCGKRSGERCTSGPVRAEQPPTGALDAVPQSRPTPPASPPPARRRMPAWLSSFTTTAPPAGPTLRRRCPAAPARAAACGGGASSTQTSSAPATTPSRSGRWPSSSRCGAAAIGRAQRSLGTRTPAGATTAAPSPVEPACTALPDQPA